MKLKEWRWINKIGQIELAEKLRCSQATISLAESGRKDCIRLILKRFLEIFGLDTYNKIDEFKKL